MSSIEKERPRGAKHGRPVKNEGVLKVSQGETAQHAGRRARLPRVLHTPTNVGGIGGFCSDWQRRQGALSDFIVLIEDQSAHANSHVQFQFGARHPVVGLALQVVFFVFAVLQYDVFHFYGTQSLLPRGLDLPLLRLLRKVVVVTYYGSDVRQASSTMRENPYFQLATNNSSDHEGQDRRKRAAVARGARWADRIIASRNLLLQLREQVPASKLIGDLWIQSTMDLDELPVRARSRHRGGAPTVVHAPSNPGLKGTEFIEQAVKRLQSEGVEFRYRRIQGLSHDAAFAILRDEADIVIDQVLYGGFGTLCVEAMALGLPVCCYLVPRYVEEVYPDVPIVNVTVETLQEKLRWLVEDEGARDALGHKGRRYVENHFDRDTLNERLWQLYLELWERRR